MTVNKTLAYALACLEHLGRHPNEFLDVKTIALSRGIPEAYCQKVLWSLARAGLVSSRKGQGFQLTLALESIDVKQVMDALEKETAFPASPEGAFEPIIARMTAVLHGIKVAQLVCL